MIQKIVKLYNQHRQNKYCISILPKKNIGKGNRQVVVASTFRSCIFFIFGRLVLRVLKKLQKHKAKKSKQQRKKENTAKNTLTQVGFGFGKLRRRPGEPTEALPWWAKSQLLLIISFLLWFSHFLSRRFSPFSHLVSSHLYL